MKKLNGIALGTFPFANVFGKIDEHTASEILRQYIEYGGEFIHVSLVYNNGGVEEFLGKELKKYPRDSYKIMACCGWSMNNGVTKLSGKKEDVEACCNGALQRLGLDHLDVLMSHAPDSQTPFEETIEAMDNMKKAGKCSELCVSNVSLEMLKRYNFSGAVNYIQNRFSLLNQSLSKEIIDYCTGNDIKITTYQTIERGLLSDRVINGLDLTATDLRTKKPEFAESIQLEIGKWISKEIKPIANDERLSILSLILRWTLQNQPVHAILCGISKPAYFSDYLATAKNTLSAETIARINLAYDKFSSYIQEKYQKSVRAFMGLV